jgi:hypothetical protein
MPALDMKPAVSNVETIGKPNISDAAFLQGSQQPICM